MSNFSPVENHREREKGVLVYPVYSRRSKGLSVGINLFPGKKECPFDCVYCEVFPFTTNTEFSLSQMEEDLRKVISDAIKQNIPVKDICFSGNGEPSLSLDFPDALEIAAKVRSELVHDAGIVFITNGTGLLTPEVFMLLRDAATGPMALDIWLKTDAGTDAWYEKINRCDISYAEYISKVKSFASFAPVTIQTMLCAIDGKQPSADEAREWEKLVLEMAQAGNVRKVQIYGKARPAPEDPLSTALPDEYLEERAGSLRAGLEEKNISVPVEVYP